MQIQLSTLGYSVFGIRHSGEDEDEINDTEDERCDERDDDLGPGSDRYWYLSQDGGSQQQQQPRDERPYKRCGRCDERDDDLGPGGSQQQLRDHEYQSCRRCVGGVGTVATATTISSNIHFTLNCLLCHSPSFNGRAHNLRRAKKREVCTSCYVVVFCICVRRHASTLSRNE